MAEADRARAAAMMGGDRTRRASSFPVTDSTVCLRGHLNSGIVMILIFFSIGRIHCQRRYRQASYLL
jgi:hypothetical protein